MNGPGNDYNGYEKIDYVRFRMRYMVKMFAGIAILVVSFLLMVGFITKVMGYDLEDSTILGITGIFLTTPVFLPTFRKWYSNYRKTGVKIFQDMIIILSLAYSFFLIQLLLPYMEIWFGDPGFIYVMVSYLIIYLFLLIRIIRDMMKFQEEMKIEGILTDIGSLLIVISAERDVQEYQNGYSSRPFETDFGPYDEGVMKRFCIELLKRVMIWDFDIESDGVKITFVPAMKGFIPPIFQKVKSYLQISKDGKTRVFFSPHDYEYLRLPLSYHLLCRRLVEKMRESYDIFAAGDEAAALRVFAVDKEGKGAGK